MCSVSLRDSSHKVQLNIGSRDVGGIASMTSDPSIIEDRTVLRDTHDSPGAESSRRVGSISSTNARLKNAVSFNAGAGGKVCEGEVLVEFCMLDKDFDKV